MAKQTNKIRIYEVEMNAQAKWFGDKDTAVFFCTMFL